MGDIFTYGWLLVVFLGALWLGRRRPGVIAGLGLSVYVLGQFGATGSAFLAVNSVVTKGAVALLVVSFIAKDLLVKQRFPTNKSDLPGYVFFVGLYIYSSFSVLWSLDPQRSLEVLLANLPYIVSLTLSVPLLIRRIEDLEDLQKSFVFISGITLCFLLFFREWGMRGVLLPVPKGDGEGWMSFETTPLDIGTAAGMVLIFLFYVGRKGQGLFIRCASFALGLFMLALMVRSGVRGQIIASFFSIFIYIVALRPSFGKVMPWLALFAVGLIFIPFALTFLFGDQTDMLSRFSADELARGTDDRVIMQSALYEKYINSGLFTFLFGLGGSASYALFDIYPHNIFIEILCELGVLVFLGFVFSIVFIAINWLVKTNGIVKREQRYLMLSALIYLMLVSSKQWNLLGATMPVAMLLIMNKARNFK